MGGSSSSLLLIRLLVTIQVRGHGSLVSKIVSYRGVVLSAKLHWWDRIWCRSARLLPLFALSALAPPDVCSIQCWWLVALFATACLALLTQPASGHQPCSLLTRKLGQCSEVVECGFDPESICAAPRQCRRIAGRSGQMHMGTSNQATKYSTVRQFAWPLQWIG